MATPQANGQSPTPTSGPEGSDLRSVARQVEGLLDDDGQYNPNPGQLSRGHPDYNPDDDPRNAPSDSRDDKGRFQKKAPPEDDPGPAPDEENELTGDDPFADTPADDEPEGDTDKDQAASADNDAPTDDADTDDKPIETLSELAEAMEVPVEELKGNITHTFKAADEEITVTLAELEAGYQKDADYRRSTAKLADDRRLAETDYTNRMQQYEQQAQVLSQTFAAAEQIIGFELNDPRLAHLRETDPAEWTARREEIGQRVNALNNARTQAAAQYNDFTYNNALELKGREQQLLLTKVPDWSNDHRERAHKLMETLGYNGQEIGQIFDHRLIGAALELDALRAEVTELRELKSKARDTVKRVKKDVPKLVKPGKRRSQQKGITRGNVDKLRARARKSGSVGDAAKVIESFL